MKKMKKILLSCLAVLLVGVLAYGAYYLFHYVLNDEYKQYVRELSFIEGTDFAPASDRNVNVNGMVLVSENENLKLYTNTETTEIAVYDKRSKETVYSNPIDIDQDTIAKDINISLLKSQMMVTYFLGNGATGVFNSYDHCTSVGNFLVYSIPNGIRYVYTIGDVSNSDIIVPDYLSQERLDKFVKILKDAGAESDAKYISKRYRKSSTKEGFLEITEATKKGVATMNKINKYLIAAGYTEEDYYNDMEAAGVEVEPPLSFEIPLDYVLEDDGVRVSINTEQIKETQDGKIYNIMLLRNLAAANATETGYMVLPNGSGSLMYFNNGKSSSPEYIQYVYGMDNLVENGSAAEISEKARLPLYGIQHEKYGVLTSIEEGESLASISACVAGKYNSYNYVYPTFYLRGWDVIAFAGDTGNESQVVVVENDFYKVNLEVKYTILTKEYEGYSGMANYYRKRLIAEGKLSPQEDLNKELPFYLNVIGALKRTNFILGKQYNQTFAVTTYKEAGEMADYLYSGGVSNLVMNFQGWFNGGYYHDVPDKIDLINKLGSEKQLEALDAKLRANGGKLFGDVAFQNVTYISKRYKDDIETARYYSTSYQAIFGQTNPTTLLAWSSLGYQDTLYYLLSPRFLPGYIKDFSDDIKSIDISGISLRDLGYQLISDKKRTNPVNRSDAQQVVEAQFGILKDTGKDLMAKNANYYSLPYVTDILEAPFAQNDYFMVDEEIPWYQMIVHGCIDYSGPVINLQSVSETSELVLKLVEYGAAPQFTLTHENSSELKYTGLNMLYSSTFDVWKEQAIDIYHEVNSVLKYVQGSEIVKHEILASGVKKVTYDNGISIYVNTTNKAFSTGTLTIPAKGYEMEGVNK